MTDSSKHDVRTIVDSVARLRAEHGVSAGTGWDFGGFRVWVDSNAPALLAELRCYFDDFQPLTLDAATAEAEAAAGTLTRITALQLAEPPDFGAQRTMTIGEFKQSVKGPKEAYFDVTDGRVVSKLRTGMWFMFGRDDHLAIGPCTDNPNQVVNFVNNRMIQWALHRGALLGHAAAVGLRSDDQPLPRCIAIAGNSGMGKSTLSLHMMNDRRLDFLSNDRVMIRRHDADDGDAGRVELQGVPKHPRINPGTILNNPDLAGLLGADERARFDALPVEQLWQLEQKYDGVISACFPDQRFLLHGRLVGLVLLNWQRDAGPTLARRVDLRASSKLLPRLIKQPGVFYLSGRGHGQSHQLANYLALLDGVPVLELAGGIDFDVGKQAALELLLGSG